METLHLQSFVADSLLRITGNFGRLAAYFRGETGNQNAVGTAPRVNS